MITYEIAEKIAKDRVNEDSKFVSDLFLQTDRTITKKYGWIFFYNSKRYLETLHFRDMVTGNVPFLVDIHGNVHITGTAHPLEYYLEQFDKKFDNIE